MRYRLALGVMLLAAGCARQGGGRAGGCELEGRRSFPPAASAAGGATRADGSRAATRNEQWSFEAGIRAEDWRLASERLAALPESKRESPLTRFAGARVAFELGDCRRALERLDGLEARLPELAARVQAVRADCQLEVGPHAAAAEYFSRRADPESLFKLALALERDGKLDGAWSAAGRLLGKRRLDKPLEVRAHALRARLAEARDKKRPLEASLRWLVTEAPSSGEADGADDRLERLVPSRPLTKSMRYERAQRFADEGRVELVERELSRLAEAPGAPIAEADVLRVRGFALYVSRRDYLRAAELLEKAARHGGARAPHDRFYAARALSRAHEDDRALVMYEALVRRFPGSGYAERAAYLAARLRYVLGRWPDAVRAYEDYRRRYRRGRYADQAEYEKTVALLAAGRFDAAAKGFSSLVDGARDARKRPRYRQLLGVAKLGAGRHDEARAAFREVIAERPLSLPALFAAARLVELGEVPPEPISAPAPAPPRAPLEVSMPPQARLLHDAGLDIDAEQAIIDAEAELRRTHGERADEALCILYGRLSVAQRRYRIGQSAAEWGPLGRAPNAATSWLWDCIYPRPHAERVRASAKRFDVPIELVFAVMRQESVFSPRALSPAGARGLMQLMPATARRAAEELGLDPDEVEPVAIHHNLELATHYLGRLLRDFRGTPLLAVAAYNAGPHAVSRWLESGEALPADVFAARIPYDETREYVYRVLNNYARYRYLSHGPGAVGAPSPALPQGVRASSDAYKPA